MIYDISPVNNYRGNNNSTIFDFDFYIDNENQLKVYLYDENSIKFELKNNIDYIIEGIQSENGGYITFPIEGSEYGILSDSQKISLELDLPVSQETQYNNSSLLNLEALEYSFDYLTRLIQILKRKIGLCVKVEECSDNSPQELIEMINSVGVSAQANAKEAVAIRNEVRELSNLNSNRYNEILKIEDSIGAFKEELIESGMYKFNLFDTKISDHILEDREAKGWALQGTYVSGALYPDFYNKCLEQKTSAIESEVTLGSSTLTMFVNANGHQFFNISDKNIVDTFYNTYGIADYYGIDEENERVFLPRNKYFHQLTLNTSEVNVMVEAGLPDHNHTQIIPTGGQGHGTQTPTVYDGIINANTGFASKSNPIYGNSDTVQPPSSLKLLYYCVGNTVINDAEIDAGALVSEMEKKASKVDVDGLPVFITLNLINSFTESMSQTFDLSDYLPKDNYNYEVFVTGYGNTGATSNNTLSISVSTALHGYMQVFACRTRSASSVNGAGTCSAYVGLDRKITILNSGHASTGTSFVRLQGYRRLGKNV